MQIYGFLPTQGPQGTQVILTGDFSLVWRSAWDSRTSYSHNDVVSYEGSYYYARIDNQSLHPSGSLGWDPFNFIYQFYMGESLIDTPLEIIDSNHIRVILPPGSLSGKFLFLRYNTKVSSDATFRVQFTNPRITDVIQVTDGGGTYLRILGSGFGHVAFIRINNVPQEFGVTSNTSVSSLINHSEILIKVTPSSVYNIVLTTTDGGTCNYTTSRGYGLSPYGMYAYGS